MKQIKSPKNKSININKKKIEKFKSVRRPNKFKNIGKEKNFDKLINETQVKNINSIPTKKQSIKEGETKNNIELFSTYKLTEKLSENQSNQNNKSK